MTLDPSGVPVQGLPTVAFTVTDWTLTPFRSKRRFSLRTLLSAISG